MGLSVVSCGRRRAGSVGRKRGKWGNSRLPPLAPIINVPANAAETASKSNPDLNVRHRRIVGTSTTVLTADVKVDDDK